MTTDLFDNPTLPPGVQPKHGKPYVWVTWLTPLLAGEDQCERQAWMKAHFKFDSARAENAGVSADWKAAHHAVLRAAYEQALAAGIRMTIEDQNKFALEMKSVVIGGKPDLIQYTDELVRVDDLKTGKPKAAHWWQVWLYLFALPRVARAMPGRVVGRVIYSSAPDATVTIEYSEVTAENIARVGALCRRIASSFPLAAVPSPRECGFCDVPRSLCPERDESAGGMVGQSEEF